MAQITVNCAVSDFVGRGGSEAPGLWVGVDSLPCQGLHRSHRLVQSPTVLPYSRRGLNLLRGLCRT